jgi:Coenzyme PQQ synthesis protein D (PqqD)
VRPYSPHVALKLGEGHTASLGGRTRSDRRGRWHHLQVPGTLRLRDTELEWREVEGEVVALDLRSSSYLAVNRSGARLWDALAGGTTRKQLVDLLVSEFAIPREQAASDTDAFLLMLTDQGMLVEE